MRLFSLCAAAVLAIFTSQASAEGFIGGGLGLAIYPDYVSTLTNIATTAVAQANPGTIIGGSGSQKIVSGAAKLFGGGWFNDYLGIELGYANLGKTTATITTTGIASTWAADISSTAVYEAILFRFKSSDTQSIQLKVGQYRANTNLSASVTGPGGLAATKASASNKGLLIGLGGSRKFSAHWSERMEFERFNGVGDMNIGQENITVISASVAYEF